MNRDAPAGPGGLLLAIGAYLIWGLLPLYLYLLRHVPPLELVAWRIVFTLPVCLAIILLWRMGGALRLALRNPRLLAMLAGSAVLIAINWLVYVAAVNAGQIFAASLGYYINPLMNVLAGTLFLGERLTARQWLAVAVAACGVAVLAWGALDMLWISLVLAASFGGYGLVRKLAPVGSLPGLTIEAGLLLVPAASAIAWQTAGPAHSALGGDTATALLVACAGAVTAAPLLLFAAAARRMDYSTLGFVQFLSPTMAFAIGLWVFREPLLPVQLACFVLIWLAIAIFSWDLLARRKAA